MDNEAHGRDSRVEQHYKYFDRLTLQMERDGNTEVNPLPVSVPPGLSTEMRVDGVH